MAELFVVLTLSLMFYCIAWALLLDVSRHIAPADIAAWHHVIDIQMLQDHYTRQMSRNT